MNNPGLSPGGNKIPHEKNLLEKSLSLLKKEMASRFQG
jgi:hypothetical protein